LVFSCKELIDSGDLDILADFSGKIGIRFVHLADEIVEIMGLKVDLVAKKD